MPSCWHRALKHSFGWRESFMCSPFKMSLISFYCSTTAWKGLRRRPTVSEVPPSLSAVPAWTGGLRVAGLYMSASRGHWRPESSLERRLGKWCRSFSPALRSACVYRRSLNQVADLQTQVLHPFPLCFLTAWVRDFGAVDPAAPAPPPVRSRRVTINVRRSAASCLLKPEREGLAPWHRRCTAGLRSHEKRCCSARCFPSPCHRRSHATDETYTHLWNCKTFHLAASLEITT